MLTNTHNILFRADSSSTIGTGHIMRDLVLAKQYTENNLLFATQNLKGNINHKIEEDGYILEILKSNHIDEVDTLIKKYSIDMIVIDHYGIDWLYEKTLKEKYPSLIILSFDDTYEKHYCDILLNHNISAEEKQYEGLVPKHCELQCGSAYTLLRDEFKEEKKRKTIFLAMGGADHSNINIKVLKVLEDFSDIEVNLVTTSANQNLEALEEYIEDKQWINLHINSNGIARLMKISDFAIVTPSVTLNEIFYMEIPFVAIKTADNQEAMYDFLDKNDYLVLEEFNIMKLEKSIKKLLKKIELINFIELTLDEKKMILEWRNDKFIRQWMFMQEPISLDNHLNYINSLPSQQDKKYFLVKQKGKPIGVIDITSINYIEKTAEIGLYSKPSLKGIGTILMQEIMNYAFNSLKIKTLISEVFESNESAIKLYKKFNFKKIDKRDNIIRMELKNENR